MKQDILYLYAFGETAYIHIFLDLHTSKLGSCVTCLVLIGYFNKESYKLLNYQIRIVYSRQNIHFDKGSANLKKNPKHVE